MRRIAPHIRSMDRHAPCPTARALLEAMAKRAIGSPMALPSAAQCQMELRGVQFRVFRAGPALQRRPTACVQEKWILVDLGKWQLSVTHGFARSTLPPCAVHPMIGITTPPGAHRVAQASLIAAASREGILVAATHSTLQNALEARMLRRLMPRKGTRAVPFRRGRRAPHGPQDQWSRSLGQSRLTMYAPPNPGRLTLFVSPFGIAPHRDCWIDS